MSRNGLPSNVQELVKTVRCSPFRYGVIPKVYKELPETHNFLELELFLEDVVLSAVREGLCPGGGFFGRGSESPGPGLPASPTRVGLGLDEPDACVSTADLGIPLPQDWPPAF